MTQVVVAVGLITVLSNYVRSGLVNEGLLAQPDFWQRWILLVVTILFVSYHLITYAADLAGRPADTGWARGDKSPSRIIALFLIDLAGLGAQGAMFAVLSIGVATDIGRFGLGWSAMSWLAGFAATWHLLMTLWHVVARSPSSASASHAAFGVLFGAIAAWAWVADTGFAPLIFDRVAIWTSAFAASVLALYFIRGRRLIAAALTLDSSKDDRG